MKKYVGCKIISAKPCLKDEKEGYTVIYPQKNGQYVSWSPKEVFESCYRELLPEEKEMIKLSD